MLTNQRLDEITKKQIEMQNRFRNVPKSGIKVDYLEKKFIVHRNVFWPFEDSKPLVENFKVNKGEHVLDVCTGSGVIAIFSAYKGAKKVVALDISPDAVVNAKVNVDLHGFSSIINVRLSDMFGELKNNEQFDVITGNLPFRKKTASDSVEATQWDTNLEAHRKFFSGVCKYLKPNGRIYLSQSNFGAVKEMKKLSKRAGLSINLIGQKIMPDNDQRIFYAFELKRR